MRLSHLRSSAEHRRRSSGNVTSDPNTLVVTQEGHFGHVTNRRSSFAEPYVAQCSAVAIDVSRRASVSAISGSARANSHRLTVSASSLRRSSLTPLAGSREDNSQEDDVFHFPQTKKVEESYDLNVFRIKVLTVCFVILLVASLFLLYRRFIFRESLNA